MARRSDSLDTPKGMRNRFVPRVGGRDRVGRFSEGFARAMGTSYFLVGMTAIVVAWLAYNSYALPASQFDPMKTNSTLLTLILSLQPSYAAPPILLAQNR